MRLERNSDVACGQRAWTAQVPAMIVIAASLLSLIMAVVISRSASTDDETLSPRFGHLARGL